jgi:hypothetical protein
MNILDVYVSGPTPQRRQTSPRVDTAATHSAMSRDVVPVKQTVHVNGQSKDKKVKVIRGLEFDFQKVAYFFIFILPKFIFDEIVIYPTKFPNLC